ncbi:MAG: transglycosylase domain-containing protein [Bacteroidales bacterium]
MIKKTLKVLLILFLTGFFLVGIFILSIFLGAYGRLPEQADLLQYKNKTASLVVAENGELIGKFFAQNRTNIAYDVMPDHLINSLVATEDARFFQHTGIDTRSLLRVIFKSILFRDPDSGGGSTISQQLVKNMFGRKSYGFITMPVNKIREAMIAHRLEKVYSKEDILMLYLNTVPFGENIFGIEAAAQRYFNKTTGNLRIEESATLIGMLKANTTFNPHLNPESSRFRRNVVILQMAKYNYLERAAADSLCTLPLKLDYANLESAGPADYFLVRVKNDARQILADIKRATGKEWNLEEDGLIIRTSLNFKLQKLAMQSYREHLPEMQEKLRDQYKGTNGARILREINDTLNLSDVILHAGLIAIDPGTGEIKAWVGGINFQTNPYDQILARRQLASAFKPFIYAAALEQGIRPCQYLDNKPIEISGFDDWSPSNYDLSTGGKYSLAGALARSMNIPTVNLYMEVGFDRVNEIWEKMGFSFTLDNTPSLALGTAEASVYELAIAYSAFANGGYPVRPQGIVSISTPDGTIIYKGSFMRSEERIISYETSILMSAMLQKAVREGTGATMASVYGVTFPWAGKTGTSQNYSDAWFGAFNPKLVMVTRVGAATPAIHFNHGSNGSGSTLALPLVARTLKKTELDPTLRIELIAYFPGLPFELQGALDCPDFREENFMDKVKSFFGKDKKVSPLDREMSEKGKTLADPGAPKVPKKRKSIFDIFRRKDKQ